MANRAKAVAHAFRDSFFNGASTANSKNFDGLHTLISPRQTLAAGVNGGDLTVAMLDDLVDRVKPDKPDMLVISKRARRKPEDLRRSSGTTLEADINQFPQQVEVYDGIPLLVDDFIKEDRTLGTGTDLRTIYAVRFGQNQGLMGLEHGGISVGRFGELESRDATRTRIKFSADWRSLVNLAQPSWKE